MTAPKFRMPMPLAAAALALLSLLAGAVPVAVAQSGDTMVTPMDQVPVGPEAPSGLRATGGTALPGLPGGARMPSDAVHAGAPTPEQVASFASQVDLTPLADLAVHYQGRVKSFDSFASAVMRFVSGPRQIDGQPDAFTMLDLILRPELYRDRPLVFVKKKNIRDRIILALEASIPEQLARERALGRPITPEQEQEAMRLFHDEMLRFFESGLVSPMLLEETVEVQALLEQLDRDLIRTAKPAQEIRTALAVRDPARLRSMLRLVAPPEGTFDDAWHTLDEVVNEGTTDPYLSRMPVELRGGIASAWTRLVSAWGRSDAATVNAAVGELAELLPQVNTKPEVYPEQGRLHWESWYFNQRSMTWVWIPYALCLVPFLLYIVFRWSGAMWTGMALFAVAVALHTFSVGLRWYISGRWPNANMFEAVTTAAWFGAVFTLPWEVWMRRRAIRGLVAIGAAGTCMVALMCAHFYPTYLDPHISNRMPVLVDLWLYIHTNVIIFSYALIFMAAISALIYLAWRLVRWLQGLDGVREYAKAGGAAALIQTGADGKPLLERPRTTIGQVLDGTTMILMELSFVLLWAGLVMGAIWADHSWGRPWGWDPKEVFALNTFIVFAILIHVRKSVKDKGLWTAVIAMIGAAVMVFNWVIINFTIAGLHSYA